MPIHAPSATSSLHSRFFFCRPLPQQAIHSNTKIWPPATIPATERVRAQSSNHYTASGHKPSRLSEISESTFRIRKWMEFASARTHHLSLTRELPPSTHTPLPIPGWLPLGSNVASGLAATAAGSMNANGNVTMRLGEDVTTYATLDPKLYTPTREKPWRGIWVGDYSGHGCEFLVLLQPDEGEEMEVPLMAKWVLERSRNPSSRRRTLGGYNATEMDAMMGGQAPAATGPWDPNLLMMLEDEVEADFVIMGSNGLVEVAVHASNSTHDTPLTPVDLSADLHAGPPSPLSNAPNAGDRVAPNGLADGAEDDDGAGAMDGELEYSGAIFAVKLTGDPNIPRGEYTFIAPDIGPKGTIRIATEETFEGARVVRSVGHIANRGFREDRYTPTQLILVSENRVAQYGELSQHITFFERVDIDQYLKCD